MQELRLVAVSEDGTYLVLATAGRGTRFTLPVDDRLRAAVRGHFSRLGQFEIEVESPLRPKEIQARIRSGETAEEIAESAGIPVERVRWFEGPVLQEREYMAQQAQRVTVRRPGESTPGPPLGETVEERLGRGGVDLEEAEWDSWKCEDGTWRVRLSFFEGGRPHAAEWTFDPRRRHVSPLDEIAARLTSVEWDDDALSDTVTPLVPRRPAMKVVGGDRDVRGLPAEPEQPGPPEPLRRADSREYLIERGRIADPRPGFRETSDTAPLREAPATPARRASPQAPGAAARPGDEDDLAEAEQAAAQGRDEDDARPAAAGPPQGADGAAEPRDAAPEAERDDQRDSAVREAEQASGAPAQDERGASEDESEEPRAAAHGEAPETHAESRTGEAQEKAAEAAHGDREAAKAVEAVEAVQPQGEDEPGRQSESTARPQEDVETRGEPGAPVRDERDAAASPAPGEDGPGEPRADGAKDGEAREAGEERSHRAAAPETAAPHREPEAAKPAPVKKPPAPRQPARTPAKKKPATRPTMPAAQDKPATAPPAAAASAESTAPQRPARRRKSKAKRASVPSWDEIMFGARRPD